jgi:hypothetical protein
VASDVAFCAMALEDRGRLAGCWSVGPCHLIALSTRLPVRQSSWPVRRHP